MGEILKAYMVPHPPVIVPEIGRGQENPAKSTIDAYEKIAKQIKDLAPETIIITTPHGIAYSDYIHIMPGKKLKGSFDDFNAPEVKFEFDNDTKLIEKITQEAFECGIEAGTLGARETGLDHGSLVPLYYIAKYYTDFSLVRISISGLPLIQHYIFGNCIQKAVAAHDKNVVFIGSGDLSHRLKHDGPYGFAEEGPVFDNQLVEAVKNVDFKKMLEIDEKLCNAAGECGLRSFAILAGALNGRNVMSKVLSYEGPFGVGYMVAELEPDEKDSARDLISYYESMHRSQVEAARESEDPYVSLARAALEHYVKKRKVMDVPDNLPEEMLDRKAGVFVSIKKHGRLRGCIGTINPVTDNIANEIIQNAISAGTSDPRFNPVKEYELKDLVYSVDVLGEPERIESMDQLDVKRYGVIVSSGYRRGLLLPDLEGVDTPEEQVEIALAKANISKDEDYILERFEVIRHK
ncbi:MAG: AmmeMemoRadiSam system protein A [Clostridiaceae bacterium]|nr:AmmeMemoRadiSam system protein A [Clostridiaceae bacterium]